MLRQRQHEAPRRPVDAGVARVAARDAADRLLLLAVPSAIVIDIAIIAIVIAILAILIRSRIIESSIVIRISVSCFHGGCLARVSFSVSFLGFVFRFRFRFRFRSSRRETPRHRGEPDLGGPRGRAPNGFAHTRPPPPPPAAPKVKVRRVERRVVEQPPDDVVRRPQRRRRRAFARAAVRGAARRLVVSVVVPEQPARRGRVGARELLEARADLSRMAWHVRIWSLVSSPLGSNRQVRGVRRARTEPVPRSKRAASAACMVYNHDVVVMSSDASHGRPRVASSPTQHPRADHRRGGGMRGVALSLSLSLSLARETRRQYAIAIVRSAPALLSRARSAYVVSIQMRVTL